jgi:hypothetical protein
MHCPTAGACAGRASAVYGAGFPKFGELNCHAPLEPTRPSADYPRMGLDVGSGLSYALRLAPFAAAAVLAWVAVIVGSSIDWTLYAISVALLLLAGALRFSPLSRRFAFCLPMRLRVAPHPASSHPARVAFPGCPVPRSLSAEPASESSGCPLASALRLCRRWSAQVAPRFASFGVAGFSKVLGFPSDSRLLLQRPRCRTWVAPCPASPALPAMDRRVAPTLAFFGGADLPVLELPRVLTVRYRRRFLVQVAPNSESSGTG